MADASIASLGSLDLSESHTQVGSPPRAATPPRQRSISPITSPSTTRRHARGSIGFTRHGSMPLPPGSSPPSAASTATTLTSSARFDSILALLDSKPPVSQSRGGATFEASATAQPPPPAPSESTADSASTHSNPATAPARPPAGGGAVSSVRGVVAGLKATIVERDEEIARLQAAMRRQEAEMRRQADAAATSASEAVQKTKQAAEAAASRHLTFIDKLLGDKKALARKCDELGSALEEERAAAGERMRKVAAEAARELEQAKSSWAAAEKVRVKRAVENKAEAVRAATLRAVEPDIQRLMEKHRDDVAKLKEVFAKQLHEAESRIAESKHAELMSVQGGVDAAVTAALGQERAAAADRERALVARYEGDLADLRRKAGEELHAEQRRGLDAVRQEVAKAAADAAQLRSRYEAQLEELRAAHARARAGLEASSDEALQRARR